MAISERPDLTGDHAISPWVGKHMTLDELLALPEQKPALEYVDGVVRQKVAATPVHGSLLAYLVMVFNQIAWPRELGMAFTEARFLTPEWAPVPDVVFNLSGRGDADDSAVLAELAGEIPLPSDFTEPPDIAVEIKSPVQMVSDQIQKCLRYLTVGVRIVLFIHPEEQSVLIFRPGQAPRMHQSDDRIDLDDLLPGIDLTVRAMFAAIAPAWFRRRRDQGTSTPPANSEQST